MVDINASVNFAEMRRIEIVRRTNPAKSAHFHYFTGGRNEAVLFCATSNRLVRPLGSALPKFFSMSFGNRVSLIIDSTLSKAFFSPGTFASAEVRFVLNKF